MLSKATHAAYPFPLGKTDCNLSLIFYAFLLLVVLVHLFYTPVKSNVYLGGVSLEHLQHGQSALAVQNVTESKLGELFTYQHTEMTL